MSLSLALDQIQRTTWWFELSRSAETPPSKKRALVEKREHMRHEIMTFLRGAKRQVSYDEVCVETGWAMQTIRNSVTSLVNDGLIHKEIINENLSGGCAVRKRTKRIVRRLVAPTCVAMILNPEVSLQERSAIIALRGGWATTDHFNVLADCRDMLILAANERLDQSAIRTCDLAGIALMNMTDRHTEKGKIGATGDEIRALELLCNVSEEFWKRQSGGLFVDAEAALHRARVMRSEEASMKDST